MNNLLRHVACLACLWAGAAWAEDVTLLSQDGAVEISGQILGYDGEFYRVSTDYGELTVDASGVRCDGPGCPNLTEFVPQVRVVGAAVMADKLLPALIEGFAADRRMQVSREDTPDGVLFSLLRPASGDAVLRLLLQSGTSDDGIAALVAGQTDLALALRDLRAEERVAARQAGLGDLQDIGQAVIVALDALVPAVAPGNPVQAISPTDLARVMAGVVTNWSELGGETAPINLHLPPAGSGLAQAITDRLLAPDGLQPASGQLHPDTQAVAQAVAVDPFGLALVTRTELGPARALQLSSGCGHALGATPQTVKTEDYPLTTPFFLYQPMRRLPKLGRDFMAYLQGSEAQYVVRAAGFTDQAVERLRLAGQGERLANAILATGEDVTLDDVQEMVSLMRETDRLSVTIRFEPGAPAPDAQSRGNIALLARGLEQGRFDGQRLVFVGFSDGDGGAAVNRRIALRRAQAVRDAVLAQAETADLARVEIDVRGFGEALPMACDDSDWGRRTNRRVEIWLR